MQFQKDLFSSASLSDANKNLLPCDGEVYYYGKVLEPELANSYYNRLQNEICWKPDEAVIAGKTITTSRKVAWYGDKQFKYRYSGSSKTASSWNSCLLEIKELIEKKTALSFNSCLLNLYENGSQGMAWHSDAEKDLKPNAAICSVSLGAQRKFCFKHKRHEQKVSMYLEHGSILVMQGETQRHWLHRLPPVAGVQHSRVNLTFRTIVGQFDDN